MRKILQQHPNDWISRLAKKGILREVTKKVQKTYGLYRIEPVGQFKKNHRYSFSVKDEVNVFKVSIDPNPIQSAINW